MFIPRSSDAFNSRVYSRHESPRISLAMHNEAVVFPTPAEPQNSRCCISGVFFRRDFRLPIISFWFIMVESLVGLYFSTHMVDSVIGYYLSHLLIKLSLIQSEKVKISKYFRSLDSG